MTSKARRAGSASDVAFTTPANLFFSTPAQRLAFARERYFEEGILPAPGTISDAVMQSWLRCLKDSQDPARTPAFNHVTPRLVRATVMFNKPLIDAAQTALMHLQNTLAGTGAVGVLTEARGVVVDATAIVPSSHWQIIPLAARVGIDLSEGAAGTSSPAITAQTSQACVVRGAEHFYHSAQAMYCVAAPIRNVHGKLGGVLNLFSENRPFAFDAASIVGVYATAIENQLLRSQSADQLLVQMAISPMALDTPSEGLMGISGDGRIAWMNDEAARLLGLPGAQSMPLAALADSSDFAPESLLALTRHVRSVPARLPSGLGVWVRCRAPDGKVLATPYGARQADPLQNSRKAPGTTPPEPRLEAGSLRDADRQLIAQTLQACGGNVSRAARQLGISRGRIYRHLKSGLGGPPQD